MLHLMMLKLKMILKFNRQQTKLLTLKQQLLKLKPATTLTIKLKSIAVIIFGLLTLTGCASSKSTTHAYLTANTTGTTLKFAKHSLAPATTYDIPKINNSKSNQAANNLNPKNLILPPDYLQ